MNNERALKEKFCQKVSVQYVIYVKCFLCDPFLKTRNFTANVWLINDFTIQLFYIFLTLEVLREDGGGGQIDPPPSIFLALNFCSLTDCQKLWHNCSLFVKKSFDTN